MRNKTRSGCARLTALQPGAPPAAVYACKCPLFLFSHFFFFFFNDTATTEIYTLSLHDALPIRPTGWSLRSILSFRAAPTNRTRSEEHTSELQSQSNLVCRLLLEKKKKKLAHVRIITKQKPVISAPAPPRDLPAAARSSGRSSARSCRASGSSFFFFLMIRRPPRSTLFPTRRSSDLTGCPRCRRRGRPARARAAAQARAPVLRSEEHTSELQSQSNLVCRLLLEKK